MVTGEIVNDNFGSLNIDWKRWSTYLVVLLLSDKYRNTFRPKIRSFFTWGERNSLLEKRVMDKLQHNLNKNILVEIKSILLREMAKNSLPVNLKKILSRNK